MHPPPPADVVAPPAPAAAGGAAAAVNAAERPPGYKWRRVLSWGGLTPVLLCIAVMVSAFALLASMFSPAELAYVVPALTLLMGCVIAQVGQAGAALIVTPPSTIKGYLAGFANLLGLVTLAHLLAIARSCFTGKFCKVEYSFDVIFANAFLLAFIFCISVLRVCAL